MALIGSLQRSYSRASEFSNKHMPMSLSKQQATPDLDVLWDVTSPLARWLAQIGEPELRVVVRDLLNAMGYKQVAITHGSLELGRDLVFAETDRIGRLIWRGVQVKAQPLSGTLERGGLRNLMTQCEAALDSPFTPSSGDPVHLSEVWIINSHQLTEQAKLSAQGKIGTTKSIVLIDGPMLHDLLQKHLPNLLTERSAPIDNYMRTLKQFCDTPEDYLTARFGSRIPLSHCYVPPSAHLVGVKPRCLQALPSAATAVGLSQLLLDMRTYRRLSHLRILPVAYQARAVATIELLQNLYAACSDSVVDINALVSELGGAIQRLKTFLALKDSESGPCIDPELFSEATPDFLERNADQYLRTLSSQGSFEALAPIRIPRDKIKESRRRLVSFGQTGPISKYAERQAEKIADREVMNAIAAFDDCYSQIADAFAGKAIAISQFSAVLEKLVDYFAERSCGVDNSSDEQSGIEVCEKLETILDAIVSALKGAYLSVSEGLVSETPEVQIDRDADIDRAISLSQITDILNTIFFLGPEDTLKLRVATPDVLLARVNRIALIADLGIGKTTALKRIAHGVISNGNRLPPDTVPVFVVLAAIATDLKVGSRAQLLEAATHGFSGLEVRADDELLWLLDGFDEMRSDDARNGVIQWVLDRNADPGRRVWITSRPFAMPAYIPGLRQARLESFGDEQVAEYINRFPWTSPGGQKALTTALTGAPELAELARMPLLLTLLALLSDAETEVLLPQRREGIYERILGLFMGEWDRAKGIRRVYAIKNKADRLRILERAALDLYARRQRTFSRRDFVSAYAAHVPSSLVVEPYAVADESLEEYLRDSLIIEQPGGQLGFFHFSIHEYLAAASLAGQVALRPVWNAVAEYFRDGWWEEVLVFYAGIKRDIGPLISELHRHMTPDTSIGSKRLRRLLSRWLSVADFTDLSTLRPGGSVAHVLVELDPSLGRFGYHVFGD